MCSGLPFLPDPPQAAPDKAFRQTRVPNDPPRSSPQTAPSRSHAGVLTDFSRSPCFHYRGSAPRLQERAAGKLQFFRARFSREIFPGQDPVWSRISGKQKGKALPTAKKRGAVKYSPSSLLMMMRFLCGFPDDGQFWSIRKAAGRFRFAVKAAGRFRLVSKAAGRSPHYKNALSSCA